MHAAPPPACRALHGLHITASAAFRPSSSSLHLRATVCTGTSNSRRPRPSLQRAILWAAAFRPPCYHARLRPAFAEQLKPPLPHNAQTHTTAQASLLMLPSSQAIVWPRAACCDSAAALTQHAARPGLPASSWFPAVCSLCCVSFPYAVRSVGALAACPCSSARRVHAARVLRCTYLGAAVRAAPQCGVWMGGAPSLATHNASRDESRRP